VSLRRRLLFALLGVVLAAGLVASAAAYRFARAEISALLDEELRQVALSLREHAVLDLSAFNARSDDFERRVVVQIWDRDGFTFYLSNVSTPLPLSRRPGFATLEHEGREWRMYTLQSGGQTIQAAQSTAERTRLAASAALRVLLPVLGALPLLGVLIWLVLERGFAPLVRVAAAVRARHAAALEPLPARGLPEEIAPLVGALNNLLARLADAFAAQRRFAADAAHELRTPLTALALQIQLLERARGEEERGAALARLDERVKRATRVVEQLLVLARLEPETAAQKPQRVALDALARAVASDAAPLAAQKDVALSVSADPAAVMASEDALRILAANLVDNAIRYTPPGGRVKVRTRRDGASAVLEVADNGPGIPEQERARVFDRFYRGADAAGSGSGLGLAIARQVAELHGGRIELGDGLGGRGVSVRFVAPLSGS
jgi:signal transduction histidine kinase